MSLKYERWRVTSQEKLQRSPFSTTNRNDAVHKQHHAKPVGGALKALEQQIKDCETKNSTLDADSKLLKKRRSDVIYRLNKGTKTKESTLCKYGITYDNELKKYK